MDEPDCHGDSWYDFYNNKTKAMYIRFGRAESANRNSCKRDRIDWRQMWADYRKE